MTIFSDSLAHGPAGAAPDPARYIEDPRALVRGNAIKLLRGGAEVFPVWIAAIDAALERISMEMYIFSDDAIGERVAEALCRAARRGVRVRLLYDFVGCRDTSPDFFARMRRAGVHTIGYHKVRFWRPRFWTLLRRNHRKTLICDGRIAFTGGLNIANAWMPAGEGGGGWRDAVVEIYGPAVNTIEAIFLHTWNRRAPRVVRLDPAGLVPRPAAGSTLLAVISNTELLNRFEIRRAALHAVRAGVERILLANPYFVPDLGVLHALCRAAQSGVAVKLLLPSRSDTRTLDYAARATFSILLKAGVRIFQHPAVIHTKALLVDRHFVSLGSYNLDHRSLAYNLELVVNTIDSGFNASVADMLENDMSASTEVHLDKFARRSLFTRMLEWLAYSFRHWL